MSKDYTVCVTSLILGDLFVVRAAQFVLTVCIDIAEAKSFCDDAFFAVLKSISYIKKAVF